MRGPRERQSLLAAAPEDTGVAALEAEDAATIARQPDQPGRDVGLTRRRPSAALAGIVQHRPVPREGEDARIDQRVVDDAIGPVERVQRQRRQQAGIARPGPDQPDASRREFRKV